jgi:O-antigen/teichoic acid export membrane protein
MLSGSAMMIVSISEKYRYNTYSKVVFVVLLILTNLICIPIWGILGAAIASLISKLLYNLYKYYLLKKFYKLEAYNWSYLIVLAIGLIAYFAAYFLPTIEPFYLDLVIRSAICLFLFVVLIYFSKVSDDINGIVRKGLRRIVK